MSFNVGPVRSVRTVASGILSVALIAVARVGFAAPADFTGQDLTRSTIVKPAPRTPWGVPRPSNRFVQAASYNERQNPAQGETDEDISEKWQPEGSPPAAATAPDANGTAAAASDATLSYMVREGNALGAIVGMFHLRAEDILHRNHLSEDATLYVGQVLRIPNPYAGRVRDLKKQIAVLRGFNRELQRKLQDKDSKAQALNALIENLTGTKLTLMHGIPTLTWWRRATTMAITLAVLMIGITLVTLLQTFVMRRRFVAIALANEKLSRLDQRYRLLLTRAELRLEQLYGVRPAAVEPSPTTESREEFEMERLGRELNEIMEHLGVRLHPPARRWFRFRERLASFALPAMVGSDRR